MKWIKVKNSKIKKLINNDFNKSTKDPMKYNKSLKTVITNCRLTNRTLDLKALIWLKKIPERAWNEPNHL